MTQASPPQRDSGQPDLYQIVLQGHLSRQRAAWFDGFTITLDPRGQTILTGTVVDQAALHGLLKKIRDLGLPLVSINRLDAGTDVASI